MSVSEAHIHFIKEIVNTIFSTYIETQIRTWYVKRIISYREIMAKSRFQQWKLLEKAYYTRKFTETSRWTSITVAGLSNQTRPRRKYYSAHSCAQTQVHSLFSQSLNYRTYTDTTGESSGAGPKATRTLRATGVKHCQTYFTIHYNEHIMYGVQTLTKLTKVPK